MIKAMLVICILSSSAFAKKHSQGFVVEVNDRNMKVTSPLKKTNIVSIIIKNNTFEKIVAQLRSKTKVLKRFVLFSQGKEVFQVNYKNAGQVIFVPVAPPFESANLRFGEAPYEIPKKK